MRRVLPLLAAAVVLSACGSARHTTGSSFVDYRPHAPRSSVTPLANRREARAGREAEALLKHLALPPGAVRFDHLPFGNDDLNHSDLGVSIVQMTADRWAFWRVPVSGPALLAFEKRHMVPGLHAVGGGEFDGRVVNGSPRREVSVTVVPINGRTYVRLDAGVAWIYPRSPAEAVPSSTREVDVRGGGVSRRVTDPAQVGKIVRWFDALNVAQPGPSVGCMVVIASRVTFVFRSASGARLAEAVVPSAPATNCNSIEFTFHGKRQTPLIDALSGADAFVNRVQRLLGVRFAAPRRLRPAAYRRRPNGKAMVAERKRAAGRAAEGLLQRFAAPPGASPAQRPRGYGGVLLRPGPTPAAEVVDRHAFWSLRGSLASVVAYVRSHGPLGFRYEGGGRSLGNRTPPNYELSFDSGGTRFFHVAVVQLPDRIALRVDAQVVWIYPRPAAEKVPAAAREVVVRWPKGRVKVTDPGRVERIARWLDALPVSPPGVALFCPLALGPSIELVFREASGSPVARADAPAGRAWLCSSIAFAVNGREETPLVDRPHGPSFVARLQRLLGVRLIASSR